MPCKYLCFVQNSPDPPPLSPNTITKKFWSYVKASSKSSSIPHKMYLNSTVRNNPTEVANLFN